MSFSPVDLVIFIVILGLLFDYTNGFHDAANVVSTVIATRVLTPLVAIILASVLNMIGATQISGVAKTITTGLVDAHSASQIMVVCALVGAIIWNFATWYWGIPSSSSYALVGGLVGASWVAAGPEAVLWSGLLFKVVIPMILSPLAGFLLGFVVMKGLNALLKTSLVHKKAKIFSRLQIASASLVALSHGLNDAQKSMGVITLGLFAAQMIAQPQIPLWVIIACAVVMGLGTASGGFRIIRTVGYEITKLQPFQGFAAETSASCVILTASFLGMPVSSTHMIVGSVTGVGAAKGAAHVRWSTAKKLVNAWIFTLPGAALVSGLMYQLIKWF
jgi:PiT family inorganic phosphate transporter